MEIIIGREEKATAPRLRLLVDKKEKFLATKTHVPKTVSREHCLLSVNGDEIVIQNKKVGLNPVYVNGQEIERKRVKKGDKIQLGPDMYTVDVDSILSALSCNDDGAVSIAHLEKVWNDYQNAKMKIQIRERRLNAISRFSGVITSVGILCAVIPSLAHIRTLAICITIISGAVLSIIAFRDSEKTPKKLNELAEKFLDDYVCPKCGKSFGNLRYKDLAKYVACPNPSCKVKFKHS